MRDYSLPPYSLGEIGVEVSRIGKALNIACTLCSDPVLKERGYYSLFALSQDIAHIAENFDIHIETTKDLVQLGVNLQSLITALKGRGVLRD